jgi:hypothetical protein
MNRTRITFDFEGEYRRSFEKLTQIICSSHWSSGIDMSGYLNRDHPLLVEFVDKGIILDSHKFLQIKCSKQKSGILDL